MSNFYTRRFVMVRVAFYLAIAFFVRENVTPANSAQSRVTQSAVFSSDFTEWSATFPSRLDRAMATGAAE